MLVPVIGNNCLVVVVANYYCKILFFFFLQHIDRDGDYFNSTGGLGWTITASSVKRDMDNIFQRDWSSVYTFPCC